MNLLRVSPFPGKGLLRAVVETPKGSRNKFDYDPEMKAFRLKKTLPEGMIFPYDFGFIPQTRGEDGDPLDVLILMPETVAPGCVVDCRLVAVIRARQSEPGGRAIPNDRYVTVSATACEFGDIRKPKDLPRGMLDQLEEFFVTYNKLEGRVFRVQSNEGPKAALKTIWAALHKK